MKKKSYEELAVKLFEKLAKTIEDFRKQYKLSREEMETIFAITLLHMPAVDDEEVYYIG